MLDQRVNYDRGIKGTLAMAGDVWLNPTQIQEEMAERGLTVEADALEPMLTRLCKEGDIVVNSRGGYAINCNQYL